MTQFFNFQATNVSAAADVFIKNHCHDFQWDFHPCAKENEELDKLLGRDRNYLPDKMIKFLPTHLKPKEPPIEVEDLDLPTPFKGDSVYLQFTPRFFNEILLFEMPCLLFNYKLVMDWFVFVTLFEQAGIIKQEEDSQSMGSPEPDFNSPEKD